MGSKDHIYAEGELYDLTKVLRKGLLHDLEESETGDILYTAHNRSEEFKKKLDELKSFLSSNIESLRHQVKTGVIKAVDLWELTERIMDTETEIYHRSSELEILKEEIAINLGGKKSEQLRQMLEQLSLKHGEEKRLESQ